MSLSIVTLLSPKLEQSTLMIFDLPDKRQTLRTTVAWSWLGDASVVGPSAVTVSVQINFGFGASSVNRHGQTEPKCQDYD